MAEIKFSNLEESQFMVANDAFHKMDFNKRLDFLHDCISTLTETYQDMVETLCDVYDASADSALEEKAHALEIVERLSKGRKKGETPVEAFDRLLKEAGCSFVDCEKTE